MDASLTFQGFTQEQFVAGPTRTESDLDIDPIFEKSFERVKSEALESDPDAFAVEEDEIETPSDLVPGYQLVVLRSGIALVARGEIVGGYIYCDMVIDERHRGQGLGAELVLEHFLRHDSLPTWDLDVPAYTDAGLATHQSAWRLAFESPEMIERKLARLAVPAAASRRAKP